MSKSLSANQAINSLLYDMYVVAAAIHFLKIWENQKEDSYREKREVALVAVLVKSRSLSDFLEYPVPSSKNVKTTKTKKTKKAKNDDITAKGILSGWPGVQRSSKEATETLLESVEKLRESTNKWGAHLTWQRVLRDQTKGSRPKRRLARTTSAEILGDAKRFVGDCLKNGFRLDTKAKDYWKQCQKLSS